MKEIVKVLLAEGIDEDTIHEVLDLIYELDDSTKVNCGKKRVDNYAKEIGKYKELEKGYKKGNEASVSDKAASLMAMAKQAKEVDKADAKLQKYGKLAGKGIKDPAQRKEFVDYANKNLP